MAKRPMTVDDLWKLKRIGPPSVSPDGGWAVVEVTTWDVEKDESSSNLWLLWTDGQTQKQLTNTTGKNSGPRWSPDGKSIAFTSKRGNDEFAQVYVISPEGGEARKVSQFPFGVSSLKWSGDSQTIFCIGWTWPNTPDDEAYKKREKEEKDRKSKAYVIDDATYRYWDKWIADGKRPHVFAVDVTSGKHRNLLAGTGLFLPPYEPSANDYDVSPDGTELCIVADSVKEIGMDQNLDLYAIPLKGDRKPKNLTSDNNANDTSPVYSPDGTRIAFLRQSIKNFYADTRVLMVLDRESGAKRKLTADLDRSCENPKWLPDGKRLAVEAEDKGVNNIFFVDASNGGARAVPSGFSERSIDFGIQHRVGVFLQSSFDFPPRVCAHRPGQKVAVIEHFNDEVIKDWDLGKVESIHIKGAGNADVQMWIVYPPNFDPAKRWPLVQVVHGGPHNGIMTDWSYRWNLQLWAARGWVIGCVNFHGSSGFGHKFTDSITGDLGGKPLEDVMKGTDWFEQQPWIAKNRTAAAGASYGGYMMSWLNGHTDRFKAMVCHAGVYSYHSQMASDIVRGRERALGAFPWDDPVKVDKQTSQRFAKNFKTPTLVIHGEKDYRVPVTQGFEYYNTLRLKGVPTRLVYFPDENHWILKAQNSLLWHREVFAWLEKYIGSGPTKE